MVCLFLFVYFLGCYNLVTLTLKGGKSHTFSNVISFSLSHCSLLSYVSLGDNIFPALRSFCVSYCPLCFRISIGDSSCSQMKTSLSLKRLDHLEEFALGRNSFSNLESLEIKAVPNMKAAGFKIDFALLTKNRVNLDMDLTSELSKEICTQHSTVRIAVQEVNQILNTKSMIYANSLEWRSTYNGTLFSSISWNHLAYLQSLVIQDGSNLQIPSLKICGLEQLKSISIGNSVVVSNNADELSIFNLPSLISIHIGKNSMSSVVSVAIHG